MCQPDHSYTNQEQSYQLSNRTHTAIFESSIVMYVLIGAIALCLSIKCIQYVRHLCTCNINSNRLTSSVNTRDTSEEEQYEPPEQEITVQETVTNKIASNSNKRCSTISAQEDIPYEDDDDDKDLPTYSEIYNR